MRIGATWLLLLLSGLLLPSPARTAEPLSLETRISLPRVSGRIDHLAVDVAAGRLFIAELGNGTVDVVDLERRQPTARISGLKEPQGVGWASRAGVLIIANGGDGSVRLFDGKSLAPIGSVALGSDADNVRIDPKTGTAIVGYGDGGLAVIDPERRARIAEVKLRAHPEAFQLDGRAGRIFVNVPDANEIAVVDLAARAFSYRT
jgi:DNA-binding beta-propeller fold protein YncE